MLGGTGLVGRAVARRLAEAGWDVMVASRGQRELPSEFAHVRLDRERDGELGSALGDEVDVLVDVIPYRLEDAQQPLSLAGRVGSLIAISSASVYADERGRSLDEATDAESFPELPVPIPERQPTVEPGPGTYSTRKAEIERTLLEQDGLPATVVRPCAIYGPWDTQAREWFFVKRALDGRSPLVLAYRGESVFHTTASANLAELVFLAAERPGTRIVNCGDPDPPNVLEIARAIGNALGHEWELTLLPGAAPSAAVGRTPWSTPKPYVLDMAAAEAELGYRPVVSHKAWVRLTCEWLVSATSGRDWRGVLPGAADYLGDRFDYAAEDEFLAADH